MVARTKPVKAENRQGRQFWKNPTPIVMRRDDGSTFAQPSLWRADGVSWPSWIYGAAALIAVAAVFAYLGDLPIYVPAGLAAWLAVLIGLWLLQPRATLQLLGFMHDYARQNSALFPGAAPEVLFKEAAKALGVPIVYWWPMWKWTLATVDQRTQWPQPDFVRFDQPNGVEWKPVSPSQNP